MEEYRSNSHRSKEMPVEKSAPERNIPKKVVSGKVKTRENRTRRFAEIFLPEDVSDMKLYVITDVIVPGVKKMLDEAFHSFLYGDRGSRSRPSSSRPSYGSYYDYQNGGAGRNRNARDDNYIRNYQDIVLESRRDAEEVLDQMYDVICSYKVVSVLDLYDMLDLPSRPTDNRYGWTDISSARVVPARGGGYLLKLPRAIPID